MKLRDRVEEIDWPATFEGLDEIGRTISARR